MITKIVSDEPTDSPSFNSTTEGKWDKTLTETTVWPESDLSDCGRYFHIVTTASLPWFTGTALNPLLRAAHLHNRTQTINKQEMQKNGSDDSILAPTYVTLVVPWLPPEEQHFGCERFETMEQQEAHIREWLEGSGGMPEAASALSIIFYPAHYHPGLGSIFPSCDLVDHIATTRNVSKMDVCVLEEPEHLNWFRPPEKRWTDAYRYVVGVVHTNYREYARTHLGYSGIFTAPALSLLSAAMMRAYCHRIIKLSAALDDYAPEKEIVSNVHGVRSLYFADTTPSASTFTGSDIYYVGKLLWNKGLDLLLELQDYHKQMTGEFFEISVYGSGPDQEAMEKAYEGFRPRSRRHRQLKPTSDDTDYEASSSSDSSVADSSEDADSTQLSDSPWSTSSSILSALPTTMRPKRRCEPIPARFLGRRDHLDLKHQHKIFVNPSVSEVLCTTTAEALAMNKFVIAPQHPSNEFFGEHFPNNCLLYRNPFEFVANLHWAQTHDPVILTERQRSLLSWESATDRLISASVMTLEEVEAQEQSGNNAVDDRIAWYHQTVGKGKTGDMIRKLFGTKTVGDGLPSSNDQRQA